MSRLARALGTVVVAFLLLVVADAPAGFGGGPAVIAALDPTPVVEPAPVVPEPSPTPAPPPVSGWETVFHDGFDGPAGVWPGQWHNMLWTNGAAQNGLGQLEVGHLSQMRTNQGWTLPPGTQVRVTASLLMPDTGSNYAAFWVQHPNGIDPREIDVIESYGPLKPAGAQFASHICYDDTPETAVNACAATGRAPVTTPVTSMFPTGQPRLRDRVQPGRPPGAGQRGSDPAPPLQQGRRARARRRGRHPAEHAGRLGDRRGRLPVAVRAPRRPAAPARPPCSPCRDRPPRRAPARCRRPRRGRGPRTARPLRRRPR
jgi:hypothetical protein